MLALKLADHEILSKRVAARTPGGHAMNHVLIVDDDADSAATMRELVGVDRFSVAVAHTLRDARRQMAMQPPSLVLLDLQLPDGNGMDLFGDQQVPQDSQIVLVTGHASLDSSIEALRRGAMDYLVKPVRSEEHTSELQSPCNLVCRLLLEKKKKNTELR